MTAARWHRDFPLLARRDVVYLDNAATTQKPEPVLAALRTYYETANANVHRAAHQRKPTPHATPVADPSRR